MLTDNRLRRTDIANDPCVDMGITVTDQSYSLKTRIQTLTLGPVIMDLLDAATIKDVTMLIIPKLVTMLTRR